MSDIAKRMRDARRAERDRVRAMNTPVAAGPDGEDHGMDLGPAALERPRSVVRVGGTIRGAAQRQAAPVMAVKLNDATLFDRMHNAAQLDDRRHSVGMRLHKLWVAAGLEPRTTARYPVMNPPDDDDTVSEDVELDRLEGETPLDQHRRVMRLMPSYMAAMLDDGCLGRHPGTSRLATFHAALDILADHWKVPKDGV